ncbi:Aerobic-type carbon monoxide dehydrogenase, middle subunit CoxM/CutM-like protein (fragment) [Rhizobium sp. EC-SD404]
MQPFSYLRATSVDEAVTAIASGARPLAGATTLYDLMKLDVERIERIVDINGLPLNEVTTEDGTLVLGALARMSDAAEHPALQSDFPALSEALWKAASQSCATWHRSAAISCNARGVAISGTAHHSPATSASPDRAAPQSMD